MKKEHIIQLLNGGHVSIPRLLLNHYATVGLHEEDCFFLIKLHGFIEHGNSFPTPEELASEMTYTPQTCMDKIQQLMQKGVLTIDEHRDEEKGYYSEAYSLLPLWERIFTKLEQQEAESKAEKNAQNEESLYTLFEREFARPLSPIECETLAMWIDGDKHEPELIKAALKESVLAGKLNFRYIDRILFEWKRNNIQTIDQARAYGEKFRKRQYEKKTPSSKSENTTNTSAPIYNWLGK
ncbi:DnaD domain-containing protein [Guptibacillus algicola]|uniref:DnaD domain-containing protein n=1 Tax=Guptibacillus algicola TaxID=225844 RepID=UPI001CD1C635|nr:DnaD domain-containing protein [Alkalihalobacillus algicola]MCA0985744.1 DnaD domain-containing protein [Alkalihalobacillus algicola]